MIKRIGLWVSASLVLAIASLSVAADDLATVEKKIKEDWAKHKSMTAKFSMTSQTSTPQFSSNSKTEGTVEWARKGGKLYSRSDLKTDATTKFNDQETKMNSTILAITDGEYSYTMSETGGQKRNTRAPFDSKMMDNPLAMLEAAKSSSDVKLLPEETLDGKKVYVIEVTPKEKTEMPGMPGKMVYYFLKDDGLGVKTVTFDQGGKALGTMVFTDVKFDVDIKPDRFKVPEGVKWEDQKPMAPEAPEK